MLCYAFCKGSTMHNGELMLRRRKARPIHKAFECVRCGPVQLSCKVCQCIQQHVVKALLQRGQERLAVNNTWCLVRSTVVFACCLQLRRCCVWGAIIGQGLFPPSWGCVFLWIAMTCCFSLVTCPAGLISLSFLYLYAYWKEVHYDASTREKCNTTFVMASLSNGCALSLSYESSFFSLSATFFLLYFCTNLCLPV